MSLEILRYVSIGFSVAAIVLALVSLWFSHRAQRLLDDYEKRVRRP